jgi:hypothetical protein
VQIHEQLQERQLCIIQQRQDQLGARTRYWIRSATYTRGTYLPKVLEERFVVGLWSQAQNAEPVLELVRHEALIQHCCCYVCANLDKALTLQQPQKR